jgi:hypothetical protein
MTHFTIPKYNSCSNIVYQHSISTLYTTIDGKLLEDGTYKALLCDMSGPHSVVYMLSFNLHVCFQWGKSHIMEFAFIRFAFALTGLLNTGMNRKYLWKSISNLNKALQMSSSLQNAENVFMYWFACRVCTWSTKQIL